MRGCNLLLRFNRVSSSQQVYLLSKPHRQSDDFGLLNDVSRELLMGLLFGHYW